MREKKRKLTASKKRMGAVMIFLNVLSLSLPLLPSSTASRSLEGAEPVMLAWRRD
jgi:hypothetical protein